MVIQTKKSKHPNVLWTDKLENWEEDVINNLGQIPSRFLHHDILFYK